MKEIKKKSALREWIEAAIFAAFLAFCIIRPFIVQAFKIPSGSMRPTLVEGDLILVNKFIYGAKIPLTKYRLPAVRQPKRGDIVVFIYPEDRKKDFIKRMVGLPGDVVEIKNGMIIVNGEPLLDEVFNQHFYYNRGDFAQEGEKLNVPVDSYFVLGDNSGSSKDSRFWGFVPADNILGEAMVIYWPPQRIRILK